MSVGLEIAGPDVQDYAENSADVVASYTPLGPVGGSATWSLSGDDAGAFTISSSGELTFKSPPDFEMPAIRGRGQRVHGDGGSE